MRFKCIYLVQSVVLLLSVLFIVGCAHIRFGMCSVCVCVGLYLSLSVSLRLLNPAVYSACVKEWKNDVCDRKWVAWTFFFILFTVVGQS